MELTFGDVANLEQRLAEKAQIPEAAELEDLLRLATEWFEDQRTSAGAVDADVFAALCESARHDPQKRATQLAVGALRLACEADRPSSVRFALRFAATRIRSLTGQSPLWGGVKLTDAEAEEAQALFEAAIGDTSYDDGELTATAREFIAQYTSDAHLFGRLASELQVLLDVVVDPLAESEHRDIARAALTYFAVVADAIPDDLGLVGLLDDVFIVQRAVRQIHPERGQLTSFLDEVLGHWPFLKDISIESSSAHRPLSEFMLVNAALLLDQVHAESSAAGVALVVSEPGPLGLLIGLVRALAEIRAKLGDGAPPEFSPGDRLVDRHSGAEIVFQGYRKSAGLKFEASGPGNATHFQYSTRKTKGAVCHHKISDLLNFRRSTRSEGPLRRGNVLFDAGTAEIGPLERLFGSTRPIQLPSSLPRVFVVGAIGETRRAARDLRLFGAPIVDVVPTGQLRMDDDSYEDKVWTTSGAGGQPTLTVVRTPGEVREFAYESPESIAAVVAHVRPGSTDARQLARLSSDGHRVVAIVEDGDTESHEHLEASGFGFWTWDHRWFGCLHWPGEHGDSPHAISTYETRVKQRVSAAVNLLEVDVAGLDEAHDLAAQLEASGRSSDSAPIVSVAGAGLHVLLKFCRTVVPVRDGEPLDAAIDALAKTISQARSYCSDQDAKHCQALLDALRRARSAIKDHNPKAAAIGDWLARNPGAPIVARGWVGRALREEFPTAEVVTSLGTKEMPQHCLIPYWMSKQHMNSLLFPPVAQEVTLALYPAEKAWYEFAQSRRTRCVQRVRDLANKRGPYRSLKSRPPTAPVDTPRTSTPVDPDDVILRARNSHALRSIDMGMEELTDAKLVHFAGGTWAAYSLRKRLPSVTSGAKKQPEIRPVAVDALQSGDFVLLLRGSNRDALREAVDKRAPAGLRDNAELWQRALRRMEESAERLQKRLEKAGCKKRPETIYRWLEDDTIIGPMHYGDVDAIAKVANDRELTAGLADCKKAISTLRGLHLKVARELGRQVLARAREWLDAGALPDDIVEIEDRLLVATVDLVDSEVVQVPRAILNQLQEQRWLG